MACIISFVSPTMCGMYQYVVRFWDHEKKKKQIKSTVMFDLASFMVCVLSVFFSFSNFAPGWVCCALTHSRVNGLQSATFSQNWSRIDVGRRWIMNISNIYFNVETWCNSIPTKISIFFLSLFCGAIKRNTFLLSLPLSCCFFLLRECCNEKM